jgi:hypothetical protein
MIRDQRGYYELRREDIPTSSVVRFWSLVAVPREQGDLFGGWGDACWLWRGDALKEKGYGRMRVRGHTIPAHRISFALANGVLPAGMLVCHHCDNPLCVNPAHLYAGTHQDNVRDMWARGRALAQTRPERLARGERHARCKLSDEAVREIRELRSAGMSTKDLARRYGIREDSLRRILRGSRRGGVQ